MQRPDAPNVELELSETSLVHELCFADAVGVRPSVELVEARDFVVVRRDDDLPTALGRNFRCKPVFFLEDDQPCVRVLRQELTCDREAENSTADDDDVGGLSSPI